MDVHDRRVIHGNIDILRLGRNDLDIVSVDIDLLFIVALQIACGFGFCPEPLDRACHIFRLAEKGIMVQGVEPVQSTLEDVFTLLAGMGKSAAA